MLRHGFAAAKLKLTLFLHAQMVHHHGSPAPPALPDDIRGIVSV